MSQSRAVVVGRNEAGAMSEAARAYIRAHSVENASTGCWMWQRATDSQGYGLTRKFRNPTNRISLAHRVSYEAFKAPIPTGLVIDHLCRTKACVNPEHMEPVTIGENVLRGIGLAATNARASHCGHGHEYSAENTRIAVERGRHRRVCLTCQKAKQARRNERRRLRVGEFAAPA